MKKPKYTRLGAALAELALALDEAKPSGHVTHGFFALNSSVTFAARLAASGVDDRAVLRALLNDLRAR